MSIKLRDLIKAVRNCKTAADERAVIAKEKAAIRTAFREGKDATRARNVTKLIYMYLLGHSTEFGQMEPIKLMASDNFLDKKTGYLALSLLLDEGDEVLTLVENRLKVDLENNKDHIKSMALMAIANVAGEDMARDLGTEVEKYITSESPNLRKKASLAALRVVRRVPSMAENYLEKLSDLFHQKHHSVLMTGLTLLNACLELEEGARFVPQYREQIPRAKERLRKLTMPYPSEYDVQSIADPFLQVKLLQFLRIVGQGNAFASEAMADVLSELLTNTEDSGGATCANAILYEVVNTIIAIDSGEDHRSLAVRQLGKFLINKDNNLRYVALNTMLKLLHKDIGSVQHHKNTIVDCLRDPDLSIRKRALDLIYNLVNGQNIRLLLLDLMNFLTFPCTQEIREDITEKICAASARFAPTVQWHIDILIKLLVLSGTHVPEHAQNRLVTLITQSEPGMQTIAVCRLWNQIANPLQGNVMQNTHLLCVAVWCVGEFADLLVAAAQGSLSVEDLPEVHTSPEDVVTTVNAILQSTDLTVLKQYCLNALMKTVVRFPNVKLLVVPTFEAYQASLDLELQQRAWEYLLMLEGDDTSVASIAADRMPVYEASDLETQENLAADTSQAAVSVTAAPPAAAHVTPAPVHQTPNLTEGANGAAAEKAPSMLDDVFGGTTTSTSSAGAVAASTATSNSNSGLLDDIFGGGAPAAPAAPAPAAPAQAQPQVFADPFGMPAPVPQQQQQQQGFSPPFPVLGRCQAFQNEHIRVEFVMSRKDASAPHDVHISAVVYNMAQTTLSGLSLMAAVKKTAVLQEFHPAAQDFVAPSSFWVQPMLVNNNQQGNMGTQPVVFKIRLSYTPQTANTPVQTEFTVTGLPSTA